MKNTTNLLVKIEKSIWYNFRLVADKKGLTKDQAFEAALAEYIKRHSDIDIEKLRGALG
jgi:ribosomal protein S12 methylthiotransferase accessory factor YcaO